VLTREERLAGVEPSAGKIRLTGRWSCRTSTVRSRSTAMQADWASEQEKGEEAVRIWASQHLNIEIGRASTTTAGAAPILGSAGRRKARSRGAARALRGGHDRRRRRRPRRSARPGRARPRKGHAALAVVVLRLGGSEGAAAAQGYRRAADDFVKEGSCRSSTSAPRMLRNRRAGRARRRQRPAAAEKRDRHRSEQGRRAVRGADRRGVTDDMIRRLLQGPALAPAVYGLDIKLADGTFFTPTRR
jgi:hypothetical protein